MKHTYIIYAGPLGPITVTAISRGVACHHGWREIVSRGYPITFNEFLEQSRILRRH